MALWDVTVEEVRSLTVVVEASSHDAALCRAGERAQWLDCSSAQTEGVLPLEATPRAVEADCMDVVKWDLEGTE